MKRKSIFTDAGIWGILAVLGLVFNAAALELIPNVTATASSTRTGTAGDGPPSVVVDGTGLVGDAHDTEKTGIWHAAYALETAAQWFRVDLNDTYALRRIDVWNYNYSSVWAGRRSIKRANIFVSTANPGSTAPGAGAPWALVHASYYFNAAPGTAGYKPNTFVDMNGVKARYVGFEILEVYTATYRPGLSELQFYADPPNGTLILIQ